MDALLSLLRYLPPSPTPTLLKKNDVPSMEDKESIRVYLGQLEDFIKIYAQKNNPVAQYNVQLAEGLSEVHRRLLRQTSARKLPSEILQHIALCMVEDSGKLPWTFTWVCSAWRRAAVGYKQLWCTFPAVNLTGGAGQRTQSKLIVTLIQRSGNLPLKVDIREHNMKDVATSALFNLLLQQADRWTTAQVLVPPRLLKVFTRATTEMHQLRHLTIAMGASYRRGAWDPPQTLDLTKLTALESLKKLSPWPRTLLPQEIIKSHTGRMLDDDMFDHLLLLSTTLTTLTYTCNGHSIRRPQGDKISLSKLKELVFFRF